VWLLPSYLSAQVSEDSNSASSSQSPEPLLWVTLSGKPSQRPFSWQGWKRRPWSQLLFSAVTSLTATSLHSLVRSTALAQVSLANRGVWPASAKEQRTSAGYGTTSLRPFARFDPATSSWKTLQVSLLEGDSQLFSGRWPKCGSMQNGCVLEGPTWEPPIDAKDSSCWPTPKTPTGGPETRSSKAKRGGGNLMAASQEWPTPCSALHNDGEDPARWLERREHHASKKENATRAGMPLTIASKQWPTPAARDYKGANSRHHCETAKGRAHMDQLPNFVSHSSPPVPTTQDGEPSSSSTRRLNPRFVEMLMGWPLGWTGSGHVEMESWLFKARRQLLYLLGG